MSSAANTESLYQQAENKQRVVVTGNQAAVITAMIVHTLRAFHRKFDLVIDGEYSGDQSLKDSSAPMVIFREQRKPYAGLTGYHHHIGIISDLDSDNEIIKNVTAFADSSAKAGILIFDERSPSGAIGKVARTDVTAIPYGAYAYKQDKGKLYVVSSTDERFEIKISGDANMRSLSAAKEILKKTGISSGQFYTAMTTFSV